ncbi:MAG TPA: hypothetical protein RMG48_06955 [Myxococcales bacterium LLY-WYZ-16_1]|nr:hypothetical protein [Myxococcales bacterium LLY-WYZ-16_1]
MRGARVRGLSSTAARARGGLLGAWLATACGGDPQGGVRIEPNTLELGCAEVGCTETGRFRVWPPSARLTSASATLPGRFRFIADAAGARWRYDGADGPASREGVIELAGVGPAGAWNQTLPVRIRSRGARGTFAPAVLRIRPGARTATLTLTAGSTALRFGPPRPSPGFFTDLEEPVEIPAGRSFPIRVGWTAPAEYAEGTLVLQGPDGGPRRTLPIRATTRRVPVPAGFPATLELGPVAVGTGTVTPVQVFNRGGGALRLEALRVAGPLPTQTPRVETPESLPWTLPPLSTDRFSLHVVPPLRGPFWADLRWNFASNEPMTTRVTGSGVRPELWVPPEVPAGATAVGESADVPLVLSSVGDGSVRLDRVDGLEPGGDVFRWVERPGLPRLLGPGDDWLGLIRFTPPFEGEFKVRLRVHHSAATEPVQVDLRGRGVPCKAACPLPNAEPRCAGGCTVASCHAGYHDADGQPENGCECEDPLPEPAPTCARALDGGELRESDSTRVSGVVALDDVDWFRWVLRDQNTVWGEGFGGTVRLHAADPSIRFCVRTADGEAPRGQCPAGPLRCFEDRTFRWEGRAFRGDTFTLWIRVDRPEAACTPYELELAPS